MVGLFPGRPPHRHQLIPDVVDKHPLFGTYRLARRIAIGVVGGTVLALGVVMMITPGPGVAGILAGLGILAIEFAWARSWLRKAKTKAQAMASSLTSKGDPPPPAA